MTVCIVMFFWGLVPIVTGVVVTVLLCCFGNACMNTSYVDINTVTFLLNLMVNSCNKFLYHIIIETSKICPVIMKIVKFTQIDSNIINSFFPFFFSQSKFYCYSILNTLR